MTLSSFPSSSLTQMLASCSCGVFLKHVHLLYVCDRQSLRNDLTKMESRVALYFFIFFLAAFGLVLGALYVQRQRKLKLERELEEAELADLAEAEAEAAEALKAELAAEEAERRRRAVMIHPLHVPGFLPPHSTPVPIRSK